MRRTYSKIVLPKAGTRPDVASIDEEGRSAPAFPAEQFDEALAKRHCDLAEIAYEFKECLETLDALEKVSSLPEMTARALTAHFIITYARPFVDARGRGVKAEANHKWIPFGEEGMELHRTFMKLRMKLVAHTDDSEFRDRRTWIRVDSVEHPTQVLGIHFVRASLAIFHESQIPRFKLHVLGAYKLVKEKQTEVGDILLEKARLALAM